MENLSNVEFAALDITGNNFYSWILDVETYLNVKGLGETIKAENTASSQDKAKAMIFIRHHIDEALISEYLYIKDPADLWAKLKERYDHVKTIDLPTASYEWLNLRLHDFSSVNEYNSSMFRITSKLKICGEPVTENDMLEKTLTTLHASNMLLQQQCREKNLTRYSELIILLCMAEKNNDLLLKDHESRPIESKPFSEVNMASFGSNVDQGRGDSNHG